MLGYFQQVYEDHVFFERLFPKTQNSWYKYCVGVEEEKEAFLFLPRCYKHWVFPGIISRTFWHFLEMVYRARLLSAIWLREIFVCWVWVVLAPGNTQASFQMNISSAQICRPELRYMVIVAFYYFSNLIRFPGFFNRLNSDNRLHVFHRSVKYGQRICLNIIRFFAWYFPTTTKITSTTFDIVFNQ